MFRVCDFLPRLSVGKVFPLLAGWPSGGQGGSLDLPGAAQ